MLNRILKSVVVGLVSTAAVEMTYNIENITILIVLNLALIGIGYIVFSKNDKSLEEEKKKRIEADKLYRDKLLLAIEDKKLLNGIIKEISEYKNDVINEISSYKLLEKELIEENNNILKQVIEAVSDKEVLNQLLVEARNREVFESINEELKELVVLQDILKATKNKNEIKDVKESLEDIESMISRKLDDTKKAINNSSSKLSDSIEDLTDVTEKNIEVYSKINNEIITKILQLGKVNEHNINLLKDSYKILNTMIDN